LVGAVAVEAAAVKPVVGAAEAEAAAVMNMTNRGIAQDLAAKCPIRRHKKDQPYKMLMAAAVAVAMMEHIGCRCKPGPHSKRMRGCHLCRMSGSRVGNHILLGLGCTIHCSIGNSGCIHHQYQGNLMVGGELMMAAAAAVAAA
jgi:hypothetical protein